MEQEQVRAEQASLVSADQGFVQHALNQTHHFWTGTLPPDLQQDEAAFSALWDIHPEEYHTFHIHGRTVKSPRWQQAYGADYAFSGTINRALPIPQQLQPLLSWCQETLSPQLNGMLLNWYDGAQGHYIGKHRDSRKNMVKGSPIITISLGETRTFRLRPWRDTPCDHQRGYVDFQAESHTICVLPYDTNLAWTHEIPPSKRATGKRISITLRAFHSAEYPDQAAPKIK